MFLIKIKPCAKKLTHKNISCYLIVEMFSIKFKPCAKKLRHKNYLMLSHVNPWWKPSLRIKKKTLKVSEHPFKQNRVMLKNMTVLLYTYFFKCEFFFFISLNLLRPTFFNICNLSFLSSPNIGKIRTKVGPKTNYFSYFMSSCTNRIAVFNNFFHWYVANQETNQILTVFMETTLSNSSNCCYKKWTTHY